MWLTTSLLCWISVAAGLVIIVCFVLLTTVTVPRELDAEFGPDPRATARQNP